VQAPPEMLDQVAAGIPVGRIGAPEDIAEAVVWLFGCVRMRQHL
jgi:NAD(P)-dependent dehydrogenase (short-subunit alcohol dehydrogenase family)